MRESLAPELWTVKAHMHNMLWTKQLFESERYCATMNQYPERLFYEILYCIESLISLVIDLNNGKWVIKSSELLAIL